MARMKIAIILALLACVISHATAYYGKGGGYNNNGYGNSGYNYGGNGYGSGYGNGYNNGYGGWYKGYGNGGGYSGYGKDGGYGVYGRSTYAISRRTYSDPRLAYYIPYPVPLPVNDRLDYDNVNDDGILGNPLLLILLALAIPLILSNRGTTTTG